MNISIKNLTEIKGGLSKKKVYRKFEKKINKIIIDFSEDEKEFQNFLNVYDILKNINISIPKLYEVYWKRKLIVIEDFGDMTFDKIFQKKDLYSLLKLAVDSLIIIQNSILSDKLVKLEKYTFSDLKSEIGEFVNYYLPYKKISDFPVDEFYCCWEKIYKRQKFEFTSFTHKDFEFINLILLKKNNLHLQCGIIDFQNAFLGFKGWDLFSILENPRINFTRKYNEELIEYFYKNVNINIEFDTFRNHYYLLNLGRQTRLLGRWVKLINSGKKNYSNYINPTTKRIISCLINIQDEKLKQIYERVIIN